MYFDRFLHDCCSLAVALLISGLCLIPSPARAQSGLGLSPMRVEAKLAPGAQSSGSLSLSNGAAERVRFRTEILDFYLDEQAVPQFVSEAPAEAPLSCRQWISVNPMEGETPANGTLQVRYTVRAPAALSAGTYHCAMGFTSLPPLRSRPERAIGVSAAVRVICALYFTVGDSRPEGELKEVLFERIVVAADPALRAVMVIENPGTVNLRGSGTVELLDGAGSVLETQDFPTCVILPRRRQRAPVVFRRSLGDGRYSLRVRVNLGTGEIQEAIRAFTLPLPPQ